MTTYGEYRSLRIRCGYKDRFTMMEKVWDGCDAEAKTNMLEQLRAGAAESEGQLYKFGGDHW